MGDCRFCGKDAGFLRGAHSDCKQRHKDGLLELGRLGELAIRDDAQYPPLNRFIQNSAKTYYLDDSAVKERLSQVWEESVAEMVEDHVLDANEERRLMQLVSGFGLSPERLNQNRAYTRASMALVLADILTKGQTTRVSFSGGVPFILKAGEKLIYRFKDVPLMEEKVIREYHGTSQGMSFRVMKGVHYRIGGSKSRPVEHSEIQQVDAGQLGVTDQGIYFAGSRSSFRISYDKMISIQPFADAVGVCKDSASAKTQIFKIPEGWFVYNLISALASKQP